VGDAGKTVKSLENRIPQRFCGGDSLRRGAILSAYIFTFTLRFSLCRLSIDRSYQ